MPLLMPQHQSQAAGGTCNVADTLAVKDMVMSQTHGA